MNFKNRKNKLREKLEELNLDGFVTINQVNVSYLTNFSGSSAYFILTKDNSYIITDFRYYTQVQEECKDVELIKLGDTKDLGTKFIEIIPKLGINKLGFESNLPYSLWNKWQTSLPNIELVPTTDLVEDIMAIKEPEEVETIILSLSIVESALKEVLKSIKIGQTERELSAYLEYLIKKNGADKLSFDTIVVSGTRGALPHGTPSDKKINKNEFVTLDCGAIKNLYCSDITRTIFTGEPDNKAREIWELVNIAKNEAIKNLKVDMPLKELDKIARDIITNAGYGEYFGHGLGHGVGRAVHTKPRVSQHAEGNLKEGMVITIEPGIYIEGYGGVRLEDLVLVTKEGARVLNKLDCLMNYE